MESHVPMLVGAMLVFKAGTYFVLHVGSCIRGTKTVFLWEGATTPECPDCAVTYTFVGEENGHP